MDQQSRHALLLHGLGSSSASWWAVEEALASAGWNVAAPDLRGHGSGVRTSSYRLEAYAEDALSLRPSTGQWDLVIGHSLGGAIAVLAASHAAGWTRRLALLDPVLHLPAELRDEVRAGELADLDATEADVLTARPEWDARDRAAKIAGARAADPDAVAATLDENDPWHLLDAASALSVPTLVLGGDPAVFTLFPPRIAATLLRANPRIRYTVVAGAGHAPHRDRRPESIAMLREWAESPLTA